MIQFVFYFFIFLTLASAFALLFVRQILYAVLLLLVVMLCVAGLFILMQAEFIGVSQILIYAGGVAV
ncbi:MAG: NADH-quinone oxidoreductase subunit J, partial [Chryseotalea sp.]